MKITKLIVPLLSFLLTVIIILPCGTLAATNAEDWTVPKGDVLDSDGIPDSMSLFLYFYLFGEGPWEFNSRLPEDCSGNIVTSIIQNPSCVSQLFFDESLPGLPPVIFNDSEVRDPRNWYPAPFSYAKLDAAQVNWIAANVFNLSAEEISAFISSGEADHEFYQEGDHIYVSWGGIGDAGTTDAQIVSVQYDGTYYYVTYNWCYVGVDENYHLEDFWTVGETFYTILEMKEYEGQPYWSMYYHTMISSADEDSSIPGMY